MSLCTPKNFTNDLALNFSLLILKAYSFWIFNPYLQPSLEIYLEQLLFRFFRPIYYCFTLLSEEETWCHNYDLQKISKPLQTWVFMRVPCNEYCYCNLRRSSVYPQSQSVRKAVAFSWLDHPSHVMSLRSLERRTPHPATYFDFTPIIYEFWRFFQTLQSAASKDRLLKF